MQEFAKSYIENLIDILKNIDVNTVSKIVKKLDATKGRIYILGNGGSAATASHMVNDLGVGLKRRNIKKFDVMSLSDNTPVCSAISNDIGYENVFYMQLKDILKKEDLIIAISCSGNSENIIKAVKYAKEQNTSIIGITGFDGGKLKQLSDINFHIPTKKDEYGLVEDAHMILDHIIYSYYISKGNS
ncbi:SIS domain-containing protein [Sulfurimonas lithotrophica]|uniref:SIS domain-containing protein n=1 Tax=Sulfurimonas lithotrophica TaxID=2590022 RepID=A0A5P8NY60_9BACT|nr:SIS domain-containing protein [Sulfurimonas lithotrophica]QFR48344.1 SIS domain-containing protein [Sulfurimonas lithotrophica]